MRQKWACSIWIAWLSGTTTVALAGQEAPAPVKSLEEVDARGRAAVETQQVNAAHAFTLVGATVLTAAGHRFDNGYVSVEDGLITALGEGRPEQTAGLKIYDLKGAFVTPGLIDTHSHLGVYASPGAKAHGDGNEASSPTTAGVWAEHSFWPQDPGIQRAVAGGVTTFQILPGSANLIGGRGVVLHAVPHRGSRAMRLAGAPETLKMACGENPKRVYGKNGAPSTRMGNVRGHRRAFIKAEAYRKKWDDYEEETGHAKAKDSDSGQSKKKRKGKAGDPPDRDLELETLAGVLQGRVLPQIHCYRADDMLSMMQIAAEFGFSIRSFHHGLEAYKIRDLLAEGDIAVSTWADWWGFKLEAYDGIPENAAMLSEAGARAIIHSDSAVGIQRLNQEVAKAFYSGQRAGFKVTEDDALRWVTANPAWALGIEEQVGTLEVGKRADLVVWKDHPFSVYARPLEVYVDGSLRYRLGHDEVWSDFEVGQKVQP
jgi:imidazolonepropionase-like amidohydrolase